MSEYSILLPNEKAKTYQYVTLFILLINCFAFGYVFFNTSGNRLHNISLFGLVIGSGALVLFLINFFTGRLASFRAEIALIISALLWMASGTYLPAACIICFAVIGFYANRPFRVLFSEAGIRYPSFPVKIYSWKEVNNAILKDNVLTIDLANNKLIQVVLEKTVAASVDETAFNAFCKRQLDN